MTEQELIAALDYAEAEWLHAKAAERTADVQWRKAFAALDVWRHEHGSVDE